jgi:ribosomal protein S18 acetylase RimI-like enzyme
MPARNNLNNYQFRTHPIGSNPDIPESTPDTWRTDIVDMSRRINDKPLHGSPLPQGGRRVGFIEWEKSEGSESATEILEIEVSPEHRRKGLATAALRHSQTVARASKGAIPMPRHSPQRTPEGDAWAKSTGDTLPPRK